MKKNLLSTILMAGFMVCCLSCGNKTGSAGSSADSTGTADQNAAQSGRKTFVKPASSGIDLNNLADGTYSVDFSAKDFNWDDGTLTVTIDVPEVYDVADIKQLQIGDSILYNGDIVVVKKIENDVDINGGFDNGGISLLAPSNGCKGYSASVEDDASVYDEVGKVTLPLNDNFTIVDCGDDPQTPSTTIQSNQQGYIGSLPSGRRNFTSYDTTVQVKGGQIVNITRIWTP